MKKFFSEFKKFITRGNVIDLAVGMIIGAAFTAIVTALVNSIFKPLINMIPIGEGLNGLITMLVPKDATGATLDLAVAGARDMMDLTKSIYIDWGAFIMAVINFLITAFILFLIVKAINAVRDGGKTLKSYRFTDEEKAEMKEKGLSAKQMRKLLDERKAEADAKAAAEAEANKPETTEQILSEIRELLKALQPNKSEG